jgi:hypothetical protein
MGTIKGDNPIKTLASSWWSWLKHCAERNNVLEPSVVSPTRHLAGKGNGFGSTLPTTPTATA